MKKITVTENNFEKVLEKLQKRCKKHKMLNFHKALSDDLTEVKFKSNPFGVEKKLVKKWTDKNGKYKYKTNKKFCMHNKYVRVTKHAFREAYETDKKSFDAEYMYSKTKSLIFLDLSATSALVINEGDKVQFLPFGGFIVWTDDEDTRFENPLTIYKDVFFPDFINGKIKNLDYENKVRDKMIQEDAERLNEPLQWEDDMMETF